MSQSIYITGDGTVLNLWNFAMAASTHCDLSQLTHLTKELPSTRSMVEQLHAIPRYAGGTSRRLSVAHHLLWCVAFLDHLPDDIVGKIPPGSVEMPGRLALEQSILEVAVHDLAEIVSNDIPQPYKGLFGKKTAGKLSAFERGFQGAFLAGKPTLVRETTPLARSGYGRLVKFVDMMSLLPEQRLRPASAQERFQEHEYRLWHPLFRECFARFEGDGGIRGALIRYPLPVLLEDEEVVHFLTDILAATDGEDLLHATRKLSEALASVSDFAWRDRPARQPRRSPWAYRAPLRRLHRCGSALTRAFVGLNFS